MPRTRLWLALALAATVALSIQALLWSPDSDGKNALVDAVQPLARAHASLERPSASAAETDRGAAQMAGTLRLRPREPAATAPRDLFAAYSWQPPPPPSPPPAPQAPPLPFLYTGRIELDGIPIFLLLQGERVLRVGVGDEVGDFTLSSAAGQTLVFLHRPTGLSQMLAAPGSPIVAAAQSHP